MKAFLPALLFAFSLLCPCAHAQENEVVRRWFLAAEAKAKQGDAGGQYYLGVCYEGGNSVAKDYEEAVRWYRKAAEQGYRPAQLNLGLCYYKGSGVAKDYVEAVKWYRKATEQGYYSPAQRILGRCYANGEGVEKNYVEGYAWLNLASQTHEDAAKDRDDLEKKMSPQQVADAQKRTKELRAIVEAKEKAAK